MIRSLVEKRLSSTMLVHFVLIAFCYPAYTSYVKTAYSPDFVLANLFAAMVAAALVLERNIRWEKRDLLGYGILLCLAGFNAAALFVNVKFHGWYMGQVNVTVSFLLFLALLFAREDAGINSEGAVKFLLGATVGMTLVSFIPYVLGYNGAVFNGGVPGWWPDERTSVFPPYYSWMFTHKSEYAFIMVLFLAFAVRYRALYARKWIYYASVAVFVLALVICNTRATMAAAVFIFAGLMMDILKEKAGGFSWKHLLWLLPVIAVLAGMLYIFSRERDLFSLGERTYIWKAGVWKILDNPYGLGNMAGLQKLIVEGQVKSNCHNVLLNILLQFSIPAGLLCIAMFGLVAIVSVWKNFSFLTLGIWVALLIPLNMDWCLLVGQMSLTLLMLYFIFFHPQRNKL